MGAAEAAEYVADRGRLAVYIHWPFCRSKCPYCDFNSHVREAVDAARWRAALLRELDHFATQLPGRLVTSVFFGGGTPSLMEPQIAAALIERIANHWSVADDLEVTLEANPTSSEAANFRAFRAAGVNRISLGVQALDDAALRLLGREHDRAEATRAIALAQRVAPRTTFDLIYARPGQTLAAWRAELDEALAIAEGHLSLYQLTIEKGTPFHALQRAGSLALPPEDQAAAFFEVTQDVTERAGLAAYEISNHAAPGQECRHNLSYWRYEDYLGVGPGAHGRLSVARAGGEPALRAIRNHAKPETWLEAVQRDSHGNAETHALARDERVAEMLLMGLRLGEGVSLARFRARTGLSFERAVPPARLARLLEAGFLEMSEGALRTTPKGRAVLNTLLAELLT